MAPGGPTHHLARSRLVDNSMPALFASDWLLWPDLHFCGAGCKKRVNRWIASEVSSATLRSRCTLDVNAHLRRYMLARRPALTHTTGRPRCSFLLGTRSSCFPSPCASGAARLEVILQWSSAGAAKLRTKRPRQVWAQRVEECVLRGQRANSDEPWLCSRGRSDAHCVKRSSVWLAKRAVELDEAMKRAIEGMKVTRPRPSTTQASNLQKRELHKPAIGHPVHHQSPSHRVAERNDPGCQLATSKHQMNIRHSDRRGMEEVCERKSKREGAKTC